MSTPTVTQENLVAIDYETHVISPETLAPRAVCLAVCSADLRPRLFLREEGHDYLTALLSDPTKHAVGANIAYDLGVLAEARPDALPVIFAALDAGRVHDVQVLEPLHRIGTGELGDEEDSPAGRFSLASLEAKYLHRDRSANKHGPDAWRLRYAELDGVPLTEWPEEARAYPLADAEGTYRVACVQLFSEGRHNVHVEADAMRVTWARHLEACRGLTTDADYASHLEADLRAAYRCFSWGAYGLGLLKIAKPTKTLPADEVTRDDLMALGGGAAAYARKLLPNVAPSIRFSTDTKAIKSRVEAAYGGRPPLSPAGATSTDRDTLMESGDDVLRAYAQGKGLTKLLSTYVPLVQAGARAPIRPRARLVATMRASYAKPNLQNIPRQGGIREAFRARPGMVWVSVDYGAQELCTLAEIQYQLFGSSALGDQINAGIDGHSFLGARLLGITYDEFRAGLKAGDKKIKKYRQLAKPCLAGDTRVLTPRGWVPIVEVTTEDKVWDGQEWVSHRGLLRRGVKETWRAHGIGATPDHGVWVENSDQAAEWQRVLTCPSLIRSALSLARSPSSDGTAEFGPAENQAGNRGFGACVVASSSPSDTSLRTGIIPGASIASERPQRESGCTEGIGRQCPTTLPPPGSLHACRLPSLGVSTPKTTRTPTTEDAESPSRKNGERTVGNSLRTVQHCQDTRTPPSKWTASTMTEGTSPATSDSSPCWRTFTTESRFESSGSASAPSKMSCEVYDLADAGPRHRFTILTDLGPIIVSNCNFGLPGGMSPPTLVGSARDGYGVRFCESTGRMHTCGAAGKTTEYRTRTISPTCVVCLEEAINITEVWHSTYPEMRPYLELGRRLAREGRTIVSAGNGLVRLADSANAYNNHLFQNLAAQCTARALYAFTRECFLDVASPLYGNAVPVIDIHDEIIAEVREDVLTECAERQAEIQIEQMRFLTPHVRVTAEPAAMRRWFKGAELVRSKTTGRIVPWWPSDWDWAADVELKAQDEETAK